MSTERKRRSELLDEEARYFERMQAGAFAGITEDNARKSLDKLLKRLEVKQLEEVAASEEREESRSAQRRLARILVQTSFYIPQQMESKRSYERAALSLRAADEIQPRQPHILYRLARVLALGGRSDEAVESLRLAIAAGYDPARFGTSATAIRDDPGFAGLRTRADFEAIIAQLQSPSGP